jgi:hypothetical protein
MSTLGLGIVVYVAYLLLWVVVNFLVYFISIFFKRPAIYQTLAGISIVVAYIANFLIGLALLWYGITLILDGRFLAFVFYFLIGSTIATFLIKIIQVPFYIITGYLSERLDEKNFDTIDAELVEDDESDSVVKKDMKNSEELAKYFLLLYGIQILSYFIGENPRDGLRWGDFILQPFFGIVSFTLLIGIPRGVYSKLRHGVFFGGDKWDFLVRVWRIVFYIFLILTILLIVINE